MYTIHIGGYITVQQRGRVGKGEGFVPARDVSDLLALALRYILQTFHWQTDPALAAALVDDDDCRIGCWYGLSVYKGVIHVGFAVLWQEEVTARASTGMGVSANYPMLQPLRALGGGAPSRSRAYDRPGNAGVRHLYAPRSLRPMCQYAVSGTARRTAEAYQRVENSRGETPEQ